MIVFKNKKLCLFSLKSYIHRIWGGPGFGLVWFQTLTKIDPNKPLTKEPLMKENPTHPTIPKHTLQPPAYTCVYALTRNYLVFPYLFPYTPFQVIHSNPHFPIFPGIFNMLRFLTRRFTGQILGVLKRGEGPWRGRRKLQVSSTLSTGSNL